MCSGCAATVKRAPVKTGMESRMREAYEKGLAIRMGDELCGRDGDIVAEASAVVPTHAPDRAVKKHNPLRTNTLRSTNYPNPRKKRNPCATTTYDRFGHPATLFSPENAKPAQKRKPLPTNTLRPQIRLLSRPKHAWKKSPRPLPRGSQK